MPETHPIVKEIREVVRKEFPRTIPIEGRYYMIAFEPPDRLSNTQAMANLFKEKLAEKIESLKISEKTSEEISERPVLYGHTLKFSTGMHHAWMVIRLVGGEIKLHFGKGKELYS
jgi:hypothetical protein